MRTLATLITTGSILVTTITPVLAHSSREMRIPNINATINYAEVGSSTVVAADSGDNLQGNTGGGVLNSVSVMNFGRRGHHSSTPTVNVSGNNDMTTGTVNTTATTTVYANVNQSLPTTASRPSRLDRHHDSDTTTINALVNVAEVNTSTAMDTNSGYNTQGNAASGPGNVNLSGNNSMDTGDVNTTSHTTVVVNSQWAM